MSVLSKRVKVGSQIDAYWSVLSLCRDPNFNTTGKYALYHRWFPPGSPICLFDLYPTKPESKTKLIQNETAMINAEVHPTVFICP